MIARRTVSPKGWPGRSEIAQASLAGSSLAVRTHDNRVLLWRDVDQGSVNPIKGLDWSPRSIVLSSSGRWLVASAPGVPWTAIDVFGEHPVRLLGSGTASRWVYCGRDALLLKSNETVRLVECETGDTLFSADRSENLGVSSLVPIGDGRRAALVGFEPGEAENDLYLYRIGDPLPGRPLDRTNRVNAGPIDAETFLCYRGSDHRENDDDDSDELRASQLYGFSGFYVRTTDGDLMGERLPTTAVVQSEDAILVSSSSIFVVTSQGAVSTVSRQTGEWNHLGTCAAFDPIAARVLFMVGEHDVDIVGERGPSSGADDADR